MNTPQALLAFSAAAAVLSVTPGLDTALVLRSAASGGARRGLFAALGIALGCLVWGAAAAVGLGALLAASQLAYTALKWAGAAFLVYSGWKLLSQPRTRLDFGASDTADGVRPGLGKAMRQGFLTNILNPKVGVFYITFLPQFIPAQAEVVSFSLLLTVVHVAVGTGWFVVLLALIAPLGKALRRPATVRALDRVTGGVFVAFGAKLALTR